MGRDLLFFNMPGDIVSVSQFDDTVMVEPLGTREEVLSVIKELFPDTDVSTPKWIIVRRETYSLSFGMADQDPLDILLVTVHGDNVAISDVKRLSDATGWRVFDSTKGEFLD